MDDFDNDQDWKSNSDLSFEERVGLILKLHRKKISVKKLKFEEREKRVRESLGERAHFGIQNMAFHYTYGIMKRFNLASNSEEIKKAYRTVTNDLYLFFIRRSISQNEFRSLEKVFYSVDEDVAEQVASYVGSVTPNFGRLTLPLLECLYNNEPVRV